MKTLHKTIKKKWFDMIVSGEKKHEYLEIKKHWISRFIDKSNYPKENLEDGNFVSEDICFDIVENENYDFEKVAKLYSCSLIDFDTVTCRNGYNPTSPSVVWEHKGISIGEGKPEWGADPGKKYFILHIGEIISVS